MLNSLNYSLVGPPVNISETMISISNNPTTMFMSIVGELITAIAIVLLAVLLYTTLKKQNKIVALWAFGLRITEAAILGISNISAFALLYISQEYIKAGVSNSPYLQNLAGLFYKSTQYGYSINMLFFFRRFTVLLFVL